MPGFVPPTQHQEDGKHVQHVQAGIWWPAADSAKLRAAASAWRDMAHALDAVHPAADMAVLNVVADNQGPAMDAFAAYWQKWSSANGYLPASSKACIAMAEALEKYAQAVDDARRRVEELVAELATAVIIGVGLGILTIGISTAAAGAVSAGLIASAALVGVDLSITAAGIAATLVVGVTFGGLEAMAIDAGAIQPEKIWLFHDQKDFSWNEVLQWGEMGAAGGFVGGTFAVGLRAADDVLPAAMSDAMTTRFGRLVVDGFGGASASAVLDEIQYGQLDPLDLAAGAVGGMAGGGIRVRLRARVTVVEGDGPAVFDAHPLSTPDEIAQYRLYVKGSNLARDDGYLSKTGRVSTSGDLHVASTRQADLERARAAGAGTPYAGHVGHVPDTAWTGKARPHTWMDLSPRVNTSLGGQIGRYPVGFKPTEFIFNEPEQGPE